MEKIKIKTITVKNDWFNITTEDDRAIVVFTGTKDNKAVNPKLKEILAETKEGSDVELEIKPSGDKLYGNDPKPLAGAKFIPTRDKGLEMANIALQASAQLYALTKDVTLEKVLATSDKFIEYLKTKSTK